MKKILFVCGSLAPGRDGVGDYTRRLAVELIGFDFLPRMIATHDREATSIITERQKEGSAEVDAVRIPRTSSSKERLKLLQHEFDVFEPDWFSLQYVPHSFDKRGVPFRFLRTLQKLSISGKCQIMYHELWITHNGLSNPKNLVISLLEQVAVVWLNRILAPTVSHTQLPLYQERLERLGVKANPLPLYTNVAPGQEFTSEVLGNKDIFRAAFFSQMELPQPVVLFLRALREDLLVRGKQKLVVSLLGGGKDKVKNMASALTKALPGVDVEPVGFLPAEELSRRLGNCNLGITPVKHHELGKSATVAAFLSHRLPVAAPLIVAEGKSFFFPTLNDAVLSEYSRSAFETAETAAKTLDTSIISVEAISRLFVKDIDLEAITQALPNR